MSVPEQDAALRDLIKIWRLHHLADMGGARGASRFRVNAGMTPPVVREQEQDVRSRGTKGNALMPHRKTISNRFINMGGG